MIFTDDKTKKYEDFTKEDIFDTDPNIGIQYESLDIRQDTIFLLQYNCPERTCDVSCISWPDLHRHVRTCPAKLQIYGAYRDANERNSYMSTPA